MNVCESEVRIQNECALRFPILIKPTPLLEYIKTISSSIGASHILAVFDENETMKVFLDDKRLVDSLIKSGIHVMGHHLRGEYVVPPGNKVVLSNIDPVITNFDIMRLLSMYGTIVSPVIRPSISDDVELCHIGYGVRYVYMVLSASIPSKLDFRYGDQLCHVKVVVENMPSELPAIKQDSDENVEISQAMAIPTSFPELPIEDPLIVNNPDVPVVVSVQSTASETNSDERVEESSNIPVRRRGRYSKALRLKRKKITATSQAARRITRNVKHKWGARKVTRFKAVKQNKSKRNVQPQVQKPLLSTSFSDEDCSTPPVLTQEGINHNSEQTVLDARSLQLFIEEVKHQRAPLDLAKKYLGADCDAVRLNDFIHQLKIHNKSHSSHSLKIRLYRLIKVLEESISSLN